LGYTFAGGKKKFCSGGREVLWWREKRLVGGGREKIYN